MLSTIVGILVLFEPLISSKQGYVKVYSFFLTFDLVICLLILFKLRDLYFFCTLYAH